MFLTSTLGASGWSSFKLGRLFLREENLSVTIEYDVGLGQGPPWTFRRRHTGIW